MLTYTLGMMLDDGEIKAGEESLAEETVGMLNMMATRRLKKLPITEAAPLEPRKKRPRDCKCKCRRSQSPIKGRVS
jgi:hypothetical protein